MKPNEMIERYIYAVTKHLKAREDVAQELRTLIDDMLEARCKEMPPTEQDVRAVLNELGTPAQLAQKYNPDQGRSLISGEYFVQYKLVLKIVLICVVFGTTLAGVIACATQSEVEWSLALANAIGNVVTGIVYAFAFVTVLFAIFCHKGVKLDSGMDVLENLPPVPKVEIPRSEPIWGIILTMIFVVLFLGFPGVVGFAVSESGGIVTLFNESMMREAWILIVLFAAMGIVRECVRLIEGWYSKRVMLTAIVTDLVSVPLAVWWLTGENMVNPAFIQTVSNMFRPEDTLIQNLIANAQMVLLGLILFALALDLIMSVYKTMRTKNRPAV